MNIALWCVLIAGLLPYAATAIAKGGAKGYDNRDPRGWLAQQEGVRKRANFAQMNAFEAFPLFAAGVLVAEHLQAPRGTVDGLALGFIAARVLHLAMYVAGIAPLRSLAWLAGFACSVSLFVISR